MYNNNMNYTIRKFIQSRIYISNAYIYTRQKKWRCLVYTHSSQVRLTWLGSGLQWQLGPGFDSSASRFSWDELLIYADSNGSVPKFCILGILYVYESAPASSNCVLVV